MSASAPSREASLDRPAARPIPGLVWAFRFHADGTAEELAVDRPIEDRHDGWLWLTCGSLLHLSLCMAKSCPRVRAR